MTWKNNQRPYDELEMAEMEDNEFLTVVHDLLNQYLDKAMPLNDSFVADVAAELGARLVNT